MTDSSQRASGVKSARMPSLLIAAMPIAILALGHTVSNLIRTLPALSADLIAKDLNVQAGDVAAMTSWFHLAFAVGQIPAGVALDRFTVRSVALFLLSLTAVGAIVTSLSATALMFSVGQIILGFGCCGMLLCPMTYAAKNTDGKHFALWSAAILAVGNSGMLLSASPMAAMINHLGWRSAYITASVIGLCVFVGVLLGVRESAATGEKRPLLGEVRGVLALAASRQLRGVVVLAFVSFAVMIGLRGMWGGPWLMDVKGLDRVHAGNVLFALTLALICAPMGIGLIDRKAGHRTGLLVLGHTLAGVALLLMVAGAEGGWLSDALGFSGLPVSYDIGLFVVFGLLISVQPLLFAVGREAVSPDDAGKALAAVNLSFFVGTAVIQAASSPVDTTFGVHGVLIFLGGLAIGASFVFAMLARRRH